MLSLLLGLALAQTPDLTGTWQLTYDIVTKNDVPVIGALKSTSRTLVLARITERDGTLAVTHDVCGSVIDGGVVKSQLPDAYLSHIPQKRYELAVEQKDGMGAPGHRHGDLIEMGLHGVCIGEGHGECRADAPCRADRPE